MNDVLYEIQKNAGEKKTRKSNVRCSISAVLILTYG